MLTSVRTNVKKTFFLDIEIVLSLRDNRTDNVKRIIINPILTMISSSVLKDKKKEIGAISTIYVDCALRV